MSTPTLVLATPDGIPKSILDLWDQTLFITVDAWEHEPGTESLEGRIGALHNTIMRDHQKTWFQFCRNGFKLDENSAYRNSVLAILQSLGNKGNCAIVDPLLCLFAPLWLAAMDRSVCLFYYSDPMEAAASLQVKWRFPIDFGLALWEYYVINALRHMEHADGHLLFSYPGFRREPESYMRHIRRRLKNFGKDPAGDDRNLGVLLKSDWNTSIATPNPTHYLSHAQRELFDALESGDLTNARKLTLSDRTTDLLLHYGNLRAGYEQIKREIEVMDADVNRLRRGQAKMDDAEPTVPGAVPHKSLTEVVVHVDGMGPLQFLVEPDNPIIEVLNNALLSRAHAPDELIYLHCGETENAAIYFSAGDLLAVETNPSL